MRRPKKGGGEKGGRGMGVGGEGRNLKGGDTVGGVIL